MLSVAFLDTAQTDLDRVLSLRMHLVESLKRSTKLLEEHGSPPPEDLQFELQSYRRQFLALSNTLLPENESTVHEPQENTWERLNRTLQDYRVQYQAQTEATRLAAGLLLQIEALRHKDDPHFAPLVECQRQAAETRHALQESTSFNSQWEMLEQLNSEQHPFRQLLQLVTNAEILPDDLWTELNDNVTNSFGRTMATAVARGKMECAPPPTVVTEPGCAVVNSQELTDRIPVDEVDIQLNRAGSEQVTLLENVEDQSSGSGVLPESVVDELHEIVPGVEFEMPVEGCSAEDRFTSEESGDELSSQSSIFDTAFPAQSAAPVPQATNFATLQSALTTRGDESSAPIETESIPDSRVTESIFDSPSISPTTPQLGKLSRATNLRLLSASPTEWSQAESRPRFNPTNTSPHLAALSIPSLARGAIQVDRDARHTQLSQLILQLLSDDRLAMAYHLTRGIELRLRGFETVLPSNLIRALLFGRHICYSKGEIARKVDEDLNELSHHLSTSGDAEWNEGTGLFVRAAALIPALLTSSATAGTILRSFKITPGLSHLYNYCSRLTTYGHRLQGQASDLFTPDCDLSNWENETSELQKSIEAWLLDTIKAQCQNSRSSLLFLHAHWTVASGSVSRYAESARLWSKWQECFRLVHRLVKPILYGQEQERNWVKSEIGRLTQSVQLEPNGSDLGQSLPVGVITFPLEAMVNTIREGVDFASRWLRLCASKPAQGRTLASREAEALRDEILERTDGVIAELVAYGQQHPTARTRAGIACLCGTIEHLRTIFSPHSTLALRESDPRHVLYGEFLKIPNLKMNDQWAPSVDYLTLENEILTYLSTEPRDWKAAFELQCVTRDHVATERILELNVWRTEQQREGLRRRRAGEIQICREDLQRELRDLHDWVFDPALRSVLSSSFLLELETRIRRLEVSIDSTVDYASIHDEINQIRLSVERRKRDMFHSARRAGTVHLTPAASAEAFETISESQSDDKDRWVLNDVTED